MEQESIVYGCIKDSYAELDQQRRLANRNAMLALPRSDAWPFLCQEMFSIPSLLPAQNRYQTEVIHFGASYQAVEYEWSLWIAKFEQLLRAMYWSHATVHLETELSGIHTFHWESVNDFHAPDAGEIRVRCEWVREQGLAS